MNIIKLVHISWMILINILKYLFRTVDEEEMVTYYILKEILQKAKHSKWFILEIFLFYNMWPPITKNDQIKSSTKLIMSTIVC